MQSQKRLLTEIIGWTGTVLIVAAYMLVSFNILTAQTTLYHILNLCGSAGILISTLAHRDYQPAVLNTIWAAVALVALIRLWV